MYILNEEYLTIFALYFVSMRWSNCYFNIAGQAEANQWLPWGRSGGGELAASSTALGQPQGKLCPAS